MYVDCVTNFLYGKNNCIFYSIIIYKIRFSFFYLILFQPLAPLVLAMSMYHYNSICCDHLN